MWVALRPTPRDSRGVELAACSVRRRATESAPPETATQMRSPGLMLVRSKGRAGETDIWNEDTVRLCESPMADIVASFAGKMMFFGRLFVGWHWCERQCLGERCVEGLDSAADRDTDPASSVA